MSARRRISDPVDRAVRALLGLPGALIERLDGVVRLPPEPSPETLLPLVQASARHPESRLALEEGLRHARAAELVLAYQVRGRTGFAVGGLNAPPERRRALLDAYRAVPGLRRRLLFPLRADELRAAVDRGFTPIRVGVEAVLDLPGLRFSGGRWATLRSLRNRARRHGVEIRAADPTRDRLALAATHAAWLHTRRPSWRMKLLVGSPSLDRPLDRRYLGAWRGEHLLAFVTLLPGAPGQWGVDVMARRPEAPAGAMDHLLATAAERLRDEGATTLSLGACPMAGIPHTDRGWLPRLFRLLYASRAGNRLFGFQSLHHFKAKFRPRWEPLYLAASPRPGAWSLYVGCRMWGLY